MLVFSLGKRLKESSLLLFFLLLFFSGLSPSVRAWLGFIQLLSLFKCQEDTQHHHKVMMITVVIVTVMVMVVVTKARTWIHLALHHSHAGYQGKFGLDFLYK